MNRASHVYSELGRGLVCCTWSLTAPGVTEQPGRVAAENAAHCDRIPYVFFKLVKGVLYMCTAKKIFWAGLGLDKKTS